MRRVLSSLFFYFLAEFLGRQIEFGLMLKMVPLVAVIVVVVSLLAWIVRATSKETRPLL